MAFLNKQLFYIISIVLGLTHNCAVRQQTDTVVIVRERCPSTLRNYNLNKPTSNLGLIISRFPSSTVNEILEIQSPIGSLSYILSDTSGGTLNEFSEFGVPRNLVNVTRPGRMTKSRTTIYVVQDRNRLLMYKFNLELVNQINLALNIIALDYDIITNHLYLATSSKVFIYSMEEDPLVINGNGLNLVNGFTISSLGTIEQIRLSQNFLYITDGINIYRVDKQIALTMSDGVSKSTKYSLPGDPCNNFEVGCDDNLIYVCASSSSYGFIFTTNDTSLGPLSYPSANTTGSIALRLDSKGRLILSDSPSIKIFI